MKKTLLSFVTLACLLVLASCGSSPSASTAGAPAPRPTTSTVPSASRTGAAINPAQAELPPGLTPRVALGPQACPPAVASPAYWEPIVKPYTYGGSYKVTQVSCASMVGNPSLQALVNVSRLDDANTLDVFVFTNITATPPAKVFQVMGLVQGNAKVSGYSTVLTAQADELSALNKGKPPSAMTADLFREFKWSEGATTLVQTVFPGMFPDLTRFQAEADQDQVNQGHQPWKLSATQVAIALAASLLAWSPNSQATLLSGGGPHNVGAVVRVKNNIPVGGSITVTFSRLEGNTNGGIWEAISVTASGLSITGPASLAHIVSPLQVSGTGSAFEGVIGKVIVLDHLYNSLGQVGAIGASGMGQTSFSATLSYQSTFPAGIQEGMLILSAPSNANGSIAAEFMEKVLIEP